MKRHLEFSAEQKAMLDRMSIPFDYQDVDEDQLDVLEDIVAEYMFFNFIGEDNELTKDGLVCESILDIVIDY